MGSLTQALSNFLKQELGTRFRMKEKITEIPRGVQTVLSIPAYWAAPLVKTEDPFLSHALSQVSYTPLVTATAFVENRAFSRVPSGVGVLIPEVEAECESLGILFNSSAFPDRVKDSKSVSSYTLMMGGSGSPEVLEHPDSEIIERVARELRRVLGMTMSAEVKEVKITRWYQAIPKYSPLLRKVWEAAQRGWCSRSGLVVFSIYTGQVSLRGMIESSLKF
jgi:protoporphyrinogen oxidase